MENIWYGVRNRLDNNNLESSSCPGDVIECYPLTNLVGETAELEEFSKEWRSNILGQVNQSSSYFETGDVKEEIRNELLAPAAKECGTKN